MPKGVYKRTKEHKESYRRAMKNRPLAPRCELCGSFKKRLGLHICIDMEENARKNLNNDESRRKVKETLQKMRDEGKIQGYWIGKKRSEETIRKISEKKKLLYSLGLHKLNPKIKKGVTLNTGRTHFKEGEFSNEKHPNWKGGITPRNKKRWGVGVYQKWRKKVFIRDKYICQVCKIVGGKLNAHHIKYISEFPELIHNVDNGITMCIKCHRAYHKKHGWCKYNDKQDKKK